MELLYMNSIKFSLRHIPNEVEIGQHRQHSRTLLMRHAWVTGKICKESSDMYELMTSPVLVHLIIKASTHGATFACNFNGDRLDKKCYTFEFFSCKL